MKVLFCDIDGVICIQSSSTISFGNNVLLEKFDINCIDQLKRILATTGAKIVISSSWRKLFDHEDIISHFVGYGIGGDNIIDFTPILRDHRGNEIQDWLNNNKVDNFAIVDDDADMCHLLPHLIQTNYKTGLTKEIADKVIEKLGIRND